MRQNMAVHFFIKLVQIKSGVERKHMQIVKMGRVLNGEGQGIGRHAVFNTEKFK